MTRLEDVVTETLRERALDIPDDEPHPVTQVVKQRSTHHLRTALISIAATSLVVAGFVIVRAGVSGPENNPSATSEGTDGATSFPDIRGLTGEQLGDALGLEPVKWPVPGGCRAFAEYDNPWGFCFDQLILDDRAAAHILGRQITGVQPPTPIQADYLAAVLELQAMTDGSIPYNAEREADLAATIADLAGQIDSLYPPGAKLPD